MARAAASRARPLLRVLLVVLALAPLGAGGAVSYVGSGATTVTISTTTCTPASAGVTWQADDILLVVTESENEAITLGTANGFAEVTGSPQSAGTAATNPGSRLAVFWKRATSAADAMPVVADSGDHTTCRLYAFRGVRTAGDPWNVTAGGNDGGANDTGALVPGATTTVAGTMVVAITSTSNNATSTTNCGTATNASLTSLTERGDSTNTSGLGGGHCLWTGDLATATTYASTTSTLTATSYKGALSIALEPPTYSAGPTDVAQSAVFGATSGTAASITGVSITGSTSTLAVAYVHIGGSADYRGTISFTSAGGLSWTLRSQAAATPSGQTLGAETTQVWTAPVASSISTQTITVATSGGGTYGLNLLLSVYTGADTANLGDGANGGTQSGTGSASGAGAGTSGAATASITPTATRSVLVAAGGEWDGAAARTLEFSQEMIRESRDTTNNADHWAQRLQGGTTSTAADTLETTNSAASAWSMAALEIREASSGASYSDPVTEAVSAAESLATAVTWSSSTSETAAAADALSSAGTWPNATTEVASLADALVGGLLLAEASSEPVTPGEQLATAHAMANATTEAAAPDDSLSTSVAWANAVTETATALDALATSAVWPNELVEALTAAAEVTDQLNGGGTNYVEAVTEALTVLEAMGAVASMTVSVGEAAAPGDALGAGNATAASVTEVLVPLDGYAVTVLRQAVVNEALAAQESLAMAAAYASTLTEAASAEDAVAAQAQLVDALAEPVGLLDVVTGGTVDLTHAPRLLVRVRRPELALVVERPVVAARVTRPTLRVRFSR